MQEDWSSVRVLVVGGSRGIGRGIAATFAGLGAVVAISGRTAESAERVAAGIESDVPVATVAGDIGSRDGAHQVVEAAVAALGGLDVICVNAGIYPEEAIEAITEEHLSQVLETNVHGTVFAVQAAAPHLKLGQRGRVVLTSSITGPVTGFPGLSAYGASKAAQLGFLRSAALELASAGITVNAVLPGSVWTESLEELGADAVAAMHSCIPAGRIGQPEDIGAAAAFFASAGAGFVTGQALVVDGGQTLPELPWSN